MVGMDYSQLGTSNKRKENDRDHENLRNLMLKQWSSIRDFNKQPFDQIKEWQLQRLIELVTHAFNTVPLYNQKYSEVGFKPGNLKSFADFEQLPILTKDELINGFPDNTISTEHSTEFTTRSSGSSGRFVTLAVSPDALYIDTVQGARQFLFQSGGNYNPDDLALFIYTAPWWFSSIDGDYATEFLPTTTLVDESIAKIHELKPTVLSVYPTYLHKLYESGANLKDAGIELVVIHSEQSSPGQRNELSRFFGIPVLDEFSSEELTRIALECPSHRYHLEEDACYIEIIDHTTNKILPNGSRGLVIGTNLLNEATPIIRYFQGDFATMAGITDCECDSSFRVIESPEGRVIDSLVTQKGDHVPASCLMDLAYNWYLELDVPVHGMKYQIVQESELKVNVHLIPGSYQLSPSQLLRVKESMYQLLPREIDVDVIVSKEPPINKGEKYRSVISLIDKGI